jgi:arylsulfatase A-like enzyme
LNPWVVRNTFIGWGPNFKKQARLDAPVSLADVVPTVLTVLGIRTEATDKNHGRVLQELLCNSSPVASTHRVVKTSAGPFEASLEVSTVAGYDYIDAGSRKRTPGRQ